MIRGLKIAFLTFTLTVLGLGGYLMASKGGHDGGHEKKEKKEGGGHHSHKKGHAKKYESLNQALNGLSAEIEKLDFDIKNDSLSTVHDQTESIGETIKQLLKLNKHQNDKKVKRRIKGYLRNMLKLSRTVHSRADEKNIDKTKKFMIKMKKQWVLLLMQYPQEKVKINHKGDESHHESSFKSHSKDKVEKKHGEEGHHESGTKSYSKKKVEKEHGDENHH